MGQPFNTLEPQMALLLLLLVVAYIIYKAKQGEKNVRKNSGKKA